MKKIKFDKVSSWFTLVANLGVVAGLIFLGYETKQNTAQLRSQASYSINEGISQMNAGVYNDANLARIVLRGEKDYEALDSIDRVQFEAYQYDRINMALHILVLEEEGISNVHFPFHEFLIQEFHRKPGLQEFLSSIQESWSGSKDYYDRLLLKK